jgi:hypothetical protein
LTSIIPLSGAAIGATPSLAEADAVMASEASSAAVIRTKRLIWFSPRRVIAIRHKFPTDRFVPAEPKLFINAISEHRVPLVPANALLSSPRLQAARARHRGFAPEAGRLRKEPAMVSGWAAMRGSRSRGIDREKEAICFLDDWLENGMADPDIVETACARAWSVYLMINSGLDQDDARRALLKRFIRHRWEAGNGDCEVLAVEGLKYLKSLEGPSTE